MPATRIFLTGYMGAGKTTIGGLLAGLLDYDFLDLDLEIEKQQGCPIHEIFESRGETFFRQQEQELLMQTASARQIVVATGGGCPVFKDNMGWMNENGTTVYLRCHPGVLFHRLAPLKKRRPLLSRLSDIELMVFIVNHLEEREPTYEKAKLKVNAEQPPGQVANSIMMLMKE